MRDPLHSAVPDHIRREDLVPPVPRQREFKGREAKRWLEQKEKTRWAPIVYAIFGGATLLILFFAYTSYAFSKYRGVILPGVSVDQVSVSGLTEKQAVAVISNALGQVHYVPFHLYYPGVKLRDPSEDQIGLAWRFEDTAAEAMSIGRSGSFFAQLIDRLPIHPSHTLSVQYTIKPPNAIETYLRKAIAPVLHRRSAPARLRMDAQTGKVVLLHSLTGRDLDLGAALNDITAVLGSLSLQNVRLQVKQTPPVITDANALHVRDTVERFLSHPPILVVGKRLVLTKRTDFAPMLSFQDHVKPPALIKMNVDPNQVDAFVSSLASEIDRPAQNPRLSFAAGKVTVIQKRKNGRQLDQQAASQALLGVITSLKPGARIHLKIKVTSPPVDTSNPASLGITNLIGEGSSSFTGAGSTRLQDITAIAKTLDQDVIQPGQEVSFNTLVGTSWASRVYNDRARNLAGQLVPANSGAMQQVATTFLRALYTAGLQPLERHAHVYRLPWYEPPYGFDAVVAPNRNWDLRFKNTTGHYLLIQTRVEPVKQAVYIYVYGPNLGWKVTVDGGTIKKTYVHGPRIVRINAALNPGQKQQVSYPLDGATVVLQRTIKYPKGHTGVDEIETTYSPSQAVVEIGPSASPTPVPYPKASPTPTFNH